MGKVTITYNGAVISEAEETAPVTVQYHGSTIATLGAGESRTLSCGGKYMRSDLIIGSKTLSCGGKKMASDLGLAAEADKVEDDTITYTGAMTDQIVLMSNVAYRLLTLTSSGTLTISNSRKADVWMCNGGNGGSRGENYSGPPSSAGGAGGKAKLSSAVLIAASTSVTVLIGSGGRCNEQGGQSSFGEIKAGGQTAGPDGGTGGGYGGNSPSTNKTPGKGDGISKYPFSNQAGAVLRDTGTVVAGMNDPHSAGGGGGEWNDEESDRYRSGGAGGSDGSSGLASGSGIGGTKGGGQGGLSGGNGADGSFYGSGGGGGSYYISKTGKETVGNGGSGYQGIIYIRIPLDQSIYN